MKLVKKNDAYVPNGSLKRWWDTELWSDFFNKFLNIESVQNLPNIVEMRAKFENSLYELQSRNSFEDAASELNKLAYR
jgi:hypothetical protein